MDETFEFNAALAKSQQVFSEQLASLPDTREAGTFRQVIQTMASLRKGKFGNVDWNAAAQHYEQTTLAKANATARAFRKNPRGDMPTASEAMSPEAYRAAMAKSTLDVGTLTNLANVTGGQTFGIISLDMKAARGTVRPRSFTLYNCLNKSMANQVVDYWPYISDIGGSLPGSAFATFASQTSTPLYNNGNYQLKYINLALAYDARALTVALAAQNSYLDTAEQENANAALNILQSVNWATYWGNPTVFTTQPLGVFSQLFARNTVNFRSYAVANSSLGLSNQQLMYNCIYELAAAISGFQGFGQTTHVFGSNYLWADMQSLVTTKLDNWVNAAGLGLKAAGLVVNGDLQGMKTRFGDIQFVQDYFIASRDIPAQAVVREIDGSNFSNASITAPTSVTVAATASGISGSLWDSTYAPATTGSVYVYAAVACDSSMNESVLTYSAVCTGVAAGGQYVVTVTPANANAAGFRIYRSGLGYNLTSGQSAASFRYIGTVAANGSSAVTFTDLNAKIPGADTAFLLDLADEDQALDYRILLPLSKVELYAQAFFMPWAVAHIGAPRLRIPKFCGAITNYPSVRSDGWSSLLPNFNAQVI